MVFCSLSLFTSDNIGRYFGDFGDFLEILEIFSNFIYSFREGNFDSILVWQYGLFNLLKKMYNYHMYTKLFGSFVGSVNCTRNQFRIYSFNYIIIPAF